MVVAGAVAAVACAALFAGLRVGVQEPDNVDAARAEPVADGNPSPEFVHRQQVLTRIAASTLHPEETVDALRRLFPLSDFEQRRLLSLLRTYRVHDMHLVLEALVVEEASLVSGPVARWIEVNR